MISTVTARRQVVPPRATVAVYPAHVLKRYFDPAGAAHETTFYQRVPWAAPQLLDYDTHTLKIRRCPLARHLWHWRPVDALWDLLVAVHAEGIHHRDVHVGNIVQGAGGEPLLIDWETAVVSPSERSYDLVGPERSGVPPPDIHAGLTPQWWASPPKGWSVQTKWGGGNGALSATPNRRP